MADGLPSFRSPTITLLLVAALIGVGTAAHAGVAGNAVDSLASAAQIRSIPSPVTDLLGGDARQDDPVRATPSEDGDGNGSTAGDEPLGQHGAQPAADDAGPDWMATATWALSAGSLMLAGVAMVRLHGDRRDRYGASGIDAIEHPPSPPLEDPPAADPHEAPDPPEVTEAEDPEEPFLVEQPPTGVDGVLTVAQACIDKGDFEAAARWFETAIALRPRLTVAHFCLGLALEELGRDIEALEAFQSAKDLGGTGPAPTYRQARILARLDRRAEAMSRLGEALGDEPELRDDAAEDPAFSQLRDHPRFLAILGRL